MDPRRKSETKEQAMLRRQNESRKVEERTKFVNSSADLQREFDEVSKTYKRISNLETFRVRFLLRDEKVI